MWFIIGLCASLFLLNGLFYGNTFSDCFESVEGRLLQNHTDMLLNSSSHITYIPVKLLAQIKYISPILMLQTSLSF